MYKETWTYEKRVPTVEGMIKTYFMRNFIFLSFLRK